MSRLAALIVLVLCVVLGEAIRDLTGWPVSGPVFGLVILLAGLGLLGRVPVALDRVAMPLLRHMMLLFVPASAGIMVQYTHIAGQWPAVIAAILISSALGLVVTAWVYKRLGGHSS